MLKIFIFFLKCFLTVFSQKIENRIWFQMQGTNYGNVTVDLQTYIEKQGNCQTVNNKCKDIPQNPRARQYHSSILYNTYKKVEADSMCTENKCGPLCRIRDNSCAGNKTYAANMTEPAINEVLVEFKGPENEECPNDCCHANNEFCFRTYDNTGNEISSDEEIMLVFGGLSQNEVIVNGKNIADNCTIDRSQLQNVTLEFQEIVNQLYLLNNCGHEILNELWAYNVNKNKWHFIKPYVDSLQVSLQQKPTSRYGHSSAYLEIVDDTFIYKGVNFTRKYMYVYGGFSMYCQSACDDMWRYEISYAPQRFYPDPKVLLGNETKSELKWNRGNAWTQVFPSSTTGPGKRMFHSMIADPSYKFLYLFGGITIDDQGKYELNNDIWKYDLVINIWEKINTLGIVKIVRPIVYWDGTRDNITVTPEEYNEKTDQILLGTINDKPYYPAVRSGSTMELFSGGDKSFILIFGGYTFDFYQNFNLQKQLNDMWVYSIEAKSWLPVFPNSDNNPGPRYGATMKYIEDSKLLMYGGMNSDKIFNDLWLFNMNSNMWTEIVRSNPVVNENDWPLPVKFPSLIKFSRGLILYGGAYYLNIDSKEYNTTLVFSERTSYIVNDLWVLYSDVCPKDCNRQGLCNYGRCICNPGFYDSTCIVNDCANSYCYTDLDIFVGQKCHHCSGHGKCNGKQCECDLGWRGVDCSIQDCPNNCTASVDPSYGTCIETKPISQCNCNDKLKRGGDDCSIVFCLNDCTAYGNCDYNKGDCSCKENYYGLDCSVFIPEFRISSEYGKPTIVFILFLFIILMV